MYLLAKAAHLVAVITWMAGMLSVSQQLSQRAREGTPIEVDRLRLIDATWTVTAMSLAWIIGFWMATQARWWIQPWFVVKFFLALTLAGLHGSFAGTLRGLCENPDLPSARWHRHAPLIILTMMSTIVTLVLVQPSF